ncbi:PIN-like domain-containing protein [Geminicoccus harenae]|uniref:PIN-like domain-containing protein n=1 Tax=Geminicoccus harenae TaxID=2498453 RepID=UPI00168BA034
MKLLLDANLSPRIARAVHVLVEPDGHEVHALVDRFPAATKDEVWLESLAAENGWATLTFDRHIMKRPHEREAWLRSGVVVFALEPAWAKGLLPREQAARLILWWPR